MRHSSQATEIFRRFGLPLTSGVDLFMASESFPVIHMICELEHLRHCMCERESRSVAGSHPRGGSCFSPHVHSSSNVCRLQIVICRPTAGYFRVTFQSIETMNHSITICQGFWCQHLSAVMTYFQLNIEHWSTEMITSSSYSTTDLYILLVVLIWKCAHINDSELHMDPTMH